MSLWYGDPDDLLRAAVWLETDAQRLRDAAVAAVTGAAAAHWVSASAQRYREVVRDDADRAGTVADDLERAARLLRAHAEQVRETTAKLARLERSAVDWLQRHVVQAWISPAHEALVPGLGAAMHRAAARVGELGGAVMAAPAARRLVLSATELASLVRRSGIAPPPPFDGQLARPPAGPAAGTAPRAEAPGEGDAPVAAAVVANLAVFAAGGPLVRTEASLPGGRSRAVFAVAGPLGASLFALADGAVELSLFPAVALGRELTRAVPEPEPDGVAARIRAALGDGPAEPPSGRVPWAALAEVAPARALADPDPPETWAAQLGLHPDEAALAAGVADRTEGILQCLVFGATARDVSVGQVVWIHTDGGWVGLDPQTGPTGERVVALRPVARADLGTWLAPYLAQLLRGADDVRP